MDHTFWHEKWDKQQIGFHQSGGNPLLVKHFAALGLARGTRVFVPLCGKTRDVAWLLSQGYRVVGAELSERAVQDLFAEMDVKPDVTQLGGLRRYSAENIDILVGDIFEVDDITLGKVDAIFDRAALVALPAGVREQYTQHLIEVSGNAPQLLITFVYDQSQMNGPPFSVPKAEVRAHYGASFAITALETQDVAGGFKGAIPATETIWLLQRVPT